MSPPLHAWDADLGDVHAGRLSSGGVPRTHRRVGVARTLAGGLIGQRLLDTAFRGGALALGALGPAVVVEKVLLPPSFVPCFLLAACSLLFARTGVTPLVVRIAHAWCWRRRR